jgi:hypothetical protein
MGRRKSSEFPRAKVHGRSGMARVRVCGKEVWLGPAGSPAADQRYRQILAAWVASGGRSIDDALVVDQPAAVEVPRTPAKRKRAERPRADSRPASAAMTVGGLVLAYLASIKAGRTDAEVRQLSKWWRAREIGNALLSRAAVPVAQFGPRMLREVRDELAATPKTYKVADSIKHRARSYVNRLVRETVAMFAWGVSEELVPVEVWQALQTTPPLRAGESRARETSPRLPVTPAEVDPILPFMPPVLADMVRFCRLVSCRPMEACNLRMADVEPCAGVLKWTLDRHKTAHHGVIKQIPIGPRAEAIVRRWAAGKSPDTPVFARADRDRVKVEGTIRTKAYRSTREAFTTEEIRKAIQSACDLAERPRWTTYQLRHAGLGEVRAELGVEAEAAVAGWTSAKLAYHYAPLKFEEGAKAARRLG